MRWNKTSRWIIVVAVLAVLSILILTRVNAVQATFTDMHMITVMFRVESEIMQKTPAGQYYDSLFWKHSEEIAQLIEATPRKLEELIRVNRLFIPGLEALLDGRGNEVRITSEEVKEFEDELNWFASVGSPSLREDIQRERQRLPLDHFIGMTMDEVLNYINSSWTPDMIVQPTKTPILQTAVPHPMIQVAAHASQQTLVQNSDGKWAYYVHNGVYFEYPSSYLLQVLDHENHDYIYFKPSKDIPEEWNASAMAVMDIWNILPGEKEPKEALDLYSPDNILWEYAIVHAEFPGFQFIANSDNLPLIRNFHAFQYNQDHKLAVRIFITVDYYFKMDQFQLNRTPNYSEMVDHRYEFFQHIVDSLRIQKP